MDTKVILKNFPIRFGIERLTRQTHIIQRLIKRRHLTNQTRMRSAARILQPLTKTLHNIDLHYPILSIQTGGIEITAQYANPATKPITSAAATTAKILAKYLSVLMAYLHLIMNLRYLRLRQNLANHALCRRLGSSGINAPSFPLIVYPSVVFCLSSSNYWTQKMLALLSDEVDMLRFEANIVANVFKSSSRISPSLFLNIEPVHM